MSAKATFWAWEQAVTGNTKLVLLCLADYANDVNKAWCSTITISNKCGVTRRTVYNCLSELCEKGLITNTGYTGKGDGRDTVIYSINCTGENIARVKKTHTTGENIATTGENISPKPTIEPTIEPTIYKSEKTKPIEKPEGVNEQTWLDFIAHRKLKKAAVSNTVIEGFKREAQKAGITLQQAIAYSIERGWIGFNASWYSEQKPNKWDNLQRTIDVTPNNFALINGGNNNV